MIASPLVSVICLCHNQVRFVKGAIESVWLQTYKNIELIVVDDGSTDGSKEVIRELLRGKGILFIDIPSPVGNCKAFNQGFAASKGSYLIDLAADDQLLPPRVAEGITDFERSEKTAGVHFSDAFICDESGTITGTHYKRNAEGKIREMVPRGNVYIPLIARYFICPPTMMIRREVLEHLGGYDESLTYEDFDFWIRSSRDYTYCFNKAPLVKRRIVKNSHSRSQFRFRNEHQRSTLAVCEKIAALNKVPVENKALRWRCLYEARQCIRTFNIELVWAFLKLAFRG